MNQEFLSDGYVYSWNGNFYCYMLEPKERFLALTENGHAFNKENELPEIVGTVTNWKWYISENDRLDLSDPEVAKEVLQYLFNEINNNKSINADNSTAIAEKMLKELGVEKSDLVKNQNESSREKEAKEARLNLIFENEDKVRETVIPQRYFKEDVELEQKNEMVEEVNFLEEERQYDVEREFVENSLAKDSVEQTLVDKPYLEQDNDKLAKQAVKDFVDEHPTYSQQEADKIIGEYLKQDPIVKVEETISNELKEDDYDKAVDIYKDALQNFAEVALDRDPDYTLDNYLEEQFEKEGIDIEYGKQAVQAYIDDIEQQKLLSGDN